jgi:hypothetical protein
MASLLASDVTWAAGLGAVGAIITPIAVVVIGFALNRQLRRIEERQWRSQELIAARLRYYREIAEPLNDLMCYFTFIGSWKERTPPEIVALKRSLDRTFHVLAPFFSVEVVQAYNAFMDRCFATYGLWGADAHLKTGFRRRQQVNPESWQAEWEEMFEYDGAEPIPPEDLERVKVSYNEVLAHLAGDIQLTSARNDYAAARVVLNAG